MIVVLDSGVVGLLCSPKGGPDARRCLAWSTEHLTGGSQIVLPEIVDYETRRVYEHRRMARYARRLDALHEVLTYLPLTTATMQQAARLWGEARRTGRKTADDRALDVDVILCAQARDLAGERTVVVATRNTCAPSSRPSAGKTSSRKPRGYPIPFDVSPSSGDAGSSEGLPGPRCLRARRSRRRRRSR